MLPVYEDASPAFFSVDMGGLLSPAHLNKRAELARLIDHTLLKPMSTTADIDRLCDEALRYRFWSVCVTPDHVRQCAKRLSGSNSRVCAVISFPFGSSLTEVKLTEARRAMMDGASELDMVSNIGALKSGDSQAYFSDINQVAAYCGRSSTILKVILECCYLSDYEKVQAARIAEVAGANFVKTSTGYGTGGATASDVALLRKTVSSKTGVKASGGIGTLAATLEMIKAGASRIGTSSGTKIIEELPD